MRGTTINFKNKKHENCYLTKLNRGKQIESKCLPSCYLFLAEAEYPLNMRLALYHSVFVKGDQTYFDIDPSIGVEATALYPDIKYTTVDQFLNKFV